MTMRVVLADDEPLARERLRTIDPRAPTGNDPGETPTAPMAWRG